MLEIIQLCREAKSSEVKFQSEVMSLQWRENDLMCRVTNWNKLKWIERSKVKRNDLKW